VARVVDGPGEGVPAPIKAGDLGAEGRDIGPGLPLGPGGPGAAPSLLVDGAAAVAADAEQPRHGAVLEVVPDLPKYPPRSAKCLGVFFRSGDGAGSGDGKGLCALRVCGAAGEPLGRATLEDGCDRDRAVAALDQLWAPGPGSPGKRPEFFAEGDRKQTRHDVG